MGAVEIKRLTRLEEMYAAVELQKTYWGEDVESLVPAHMMFTLVSSGGHVLVAEDAGRMIGVLIGLLAVRTGLDVPVRQESLLLASKRMVVLPEYRGQGIGYQLKMAQRQIALNQGLRLVTWTFDPLLATNANLNLRKLGCICREYLQDYYGTDPQSSLTTLSTSDRFGLEWWVNSPAVAARASGTFNPPSAQAYLEQGAVLVAGHKQVTVLSPDEMVMELQLPHALVEIPQNYPQIVKDDPDLALRWRHHTRSVFQAAFKRGYAAVDFVRGPVDGVDRACYVLSVDYTTN